MYTSKLLIIQFYFLATSWIHAQLLDSNVQHLVNLSDGVRIILIPAADDPTHYYYVPETIQLSMKKGVPEASLLFYRDSENRIDGGILHVLLTWGLTADQETAVRRHLLKIDSSAVLMGGAELRFQDDDYLKIKSDNAFSKIFDRASTSPIRVSPQSFSKTAASFRFVGHDAALMHKAIREKSNGKNTFSIDYQYLVAQHSGHIRVGTERTGTMHTSIDQWIKALVKYNLIKYTSI